AALANAQHSTGPRSVEGKAASSKNALKLGLYAQTLLLPGEDPEQLLALSRDYTERFHPQTPIEQLFLDQLVCAEWLQRRYRRIESQFYQARLAALPEGTDPEDALTQVFMQDAEGPRILDKICRRQGAAGRQYQRALTGLLRAIAERQGVRRKPPQSPFRLPLPSSCKNEPDWYRTRPESTPAAPPSAPSAAPAAASRTASAPSASLQGERDRMS
ncbi:MAG TPA: hypothetical protein VMJ75_18140, partial [Candidatus Acidoferrales bacterium]|nr:hypothetical protein [Candidatus Acidoferrales bacterium]